MCSPVAALLVLQVAQAGAQYEAQRHAASQQKDAINQATALQQGDLQRQQAQIDAQARQQMNQQARQAMHDMALFDTVTGEFGGGGSANRARSVATVQSGEQLATIADNRNNAQSENGFQSLATKTRAQAQLASIQQPSLLQTGLSIASSALDYKTRMDAKRAPKGAS